MYEHQMKMNELRWKYAVKKIMVDRFDIINPGNNCHVSA